MEQSITLKIIHGIVYVVDVQLFDIHNLSAAEGYQISTCVTHYQILKLLMIIPILQYLINIISRLPWSCKVCPKLRTLALRFSPQ